MPYGTLNVDKIVNDNGVTFAGLYGFKNRIINGAMVIDQRNAGASVTVNSGSDFYAVDRWPASGESADGVFTVQRSTVVPAGFTNSIVCTVTTADASIGATQRYFVEQKIEGFNFADLGFGSATAQSVTISFWVRSSVTGTFGGTLSNVGSRYYPFSYTINAANTWEQKSVTIAGDTTGTWATGNTAGAEVLFSLGCGSSRKGTANTWTSSVFLAPTGSVDLIATNGATFYITGVQLERGSTATSFDFRPYGTELALCQRYFQVFDSIYIEGYANAGSVRAINAPMTFPVQMRATPTRTVKTAGTLGNVRSNSTAYAGLGINGLTATYASASIESAASGLVQCLNQSETMSAEL